MSAPDTNIEKQQRRHFPVLMGIGAVLIAIVAFIFLAPAAEEDAPQAAVTSTDTN